MARTEEIKKLATFIWSVADLSRGDYKQTDYGKVIPPFTAAVTSNLDIKEAKLDV